MRIPSMPIRKVEKALNAFDYYLASKGNHSIFKNKNNHAISIPTGRKEISKGVIRAVLKEINISECDFIKAL